MDLSERHKRLHVYVDFVLNIAKTKLNLELMRTRALTLF